MTENLINWITQAGSEGVRRTEVQAFLETSSPFRARTELRACGAQLTRWWVHAGHDFAGAKHAHSRWTLTGIECRAGTKVEVDDE